MQEECFDNYIIAKTWFLDTSWQIKINTCSKIMISKVCHKFQTMDSLLKEKPKDI